MNVKALVDVLNIEKHITGFLNYYDIVPNGEYKSLQHLVDYFKNEGIPLDKVIIDDSIETLRFDWEYSKTTKDIENEIKDKLTQIKALEYEEVPF